LIEGAEMAKKQTTTRRAFSGLGIQEKAEFYRNAMAGITRKDAIAILAAYLAAFDFVDTLVSENVGQIIGTFSAAADPEAVKAVLVKVLKAREEAQRKGVA